MIKVKQYILNNAAPTLVKSMQIPEEITSSEEHLHPIHQF